MFAMRKVAEIRFLLIVKQLGRNFKASFALSLFNRGPNGTRLTPNWTAKEPQTKCDSVPMKVAKGPLSRLEGGRKEEKGGRNAFQNDKTLSAKT